MNNVMLLSGDVHFGNAYRSPCSAISGYDLIEYTSSGMTHTINNFFTILIEFHESLANPQYSAGKYVVDLNYGEIIIKPKSNTVNARIRDMDNNVYYENEFDLSKDFQFDARNLGKNKDYCVHVQRDKLFFMRQLQMIRYLIVQTNKGLFSINTVRMEFYYLLWILTIAFWPNVFFKWGRKLYRRVKGCYIKSG